jgi:hypothetical protein
MILLKHDPFSERKESCKALYGEKEFLTESVRAN